MTGSRYRSSKGTSAISSYSWSQPGRESSSYNTPITNNPMAITTTMRDEAGSNLRFPATPNVRSWHKADMLNALLTNVRFLRREIADQVLVGVAEQVIS